MGSKGAERLWKAVVQGERELKSEAWKIEGGRVVDWGKGVGPRKRV